MLKLTSHTWNTCSQSADKTETATFAMGCFWSPDALFGSLAGVIRTRVGYAGGSTKNPTYRTLADHIETLQLDYDPDRISYEELLDVFFSNHKPFREPWKRQYMSAVFYHHKEQKELLKLAKAKFAEENKKELFTAEIPFEEWYMAEERHQKYKLQRQPIVMNELREIYPEFPAFVHSTMAARINGCLYGYGSREEITSFLDQSTLSPASREIILNRNLKSGIIQKRTKSLP